MISLNRIKGVSLSLLLVGTVSAGSISLFDDSFSIAGFDSSSDVIALRWGTYSGGVFTQLLGDVYNSSVNAGYVDFSGPELSVSLTQSNNNAIAEGFQLALAVVNIPETANYAASAPKAVLTDTAWVATAFSAGSGGTAAYTFTSNTVAQVGSFSFSASGNDSITLTAVPEPAMVAGFLGVAALGVAVWRKRRVG